MRERVFVQVGRLSPILPSFRGRTRLFLLLYTALGLKKRHPRVRAHLRRPVSFWAELDLHSWLQRIAFLTGGYEDETGRFLLELLEQHPIPGYLLDAGANVGLIAIPFAMANPKTNRVVAVEAVDDNVTALRRNIALNGLQELVTVLPVALGEESKTARIQVEGDLRAQEGSGTANILAADTTYQCVTQTIRVETLDALFASGQIPRGCSVVKIDTDGYDLKVLQGATRFLRENRPVIFGEFAAPCMAWHGQTVEDVQAFASAHRYEVWFRATPGWRFTISMDLKHFVQDLLLVPSEHRASFESHLQ